MERKFYSAKDVLFGTRREYLNLQMYLCLLEDMVSNRDRQVEDFYFEVLKKSESIPCIGCNFIQNERTLRGLIEKLCYSDSDGRKKCVIRKNGNDTYSEIGNHYYKLFVKKNMEYEFEEMVHKILQLDFINKMNFGSIVCKPKSIMYLEPNGLDIIYNTYSVRNLMWLKYLSRNDCISAVRYDMDFDDDSIMSLFEAKVPADLLSDYHRQIIDGSTSINKPIEICSLDENIDNRRFDLTITEGEDKITLTKTKIRRR